MKLWMTLYAMIWIVLIEFLLAMTPGGSPTLIYLHIILGAGIMALAFFNFSGIRNTRVPGRVKRISQASLNISMMAAVSGALLFYDIGTAWAIPLINISIYGLILFFHVLCSFAIITQAAAIAIAHDMWENHEFVEETEPGVISVLQKD